MQPNGCIFHRPPPKRGAGPDPKEHDMADIRHRVGITAPAGRVYQALATRDGLSGWWTRDVRGDCEVDGKLEFFFGGSDPAAGMEEFDLAPAPIGRASWRE